MIWRNANRDEIPEHLQEVLISVKGVYYVTTFDSETRTFRLREEPDTFFDLNKHEIYWTEFNNPDNK